MTIAATLYGRGVSITQSRKPLLVHSVVSLELVKKTGDLVELQADLQHVVERFNDEDVLLVELTQALG